MHIIYFSIFSVCVFVSAFVYMDFGYLSPSLLFVASSLLTLAGYILFDLLDGGALRSESNRTSKIFLKAYWK